MLAEPVKEELGFPYWFPIRRRFCPDSAFFSSGNVERELLAKQVALDLTENEKNQMLEDVESRSMLCPIVGCGSRLDSLDDFEDHYHARHMASCSVCSRVYPTSRLLSIHISEAHDSFFQAKVSRGFSMYECLVEGCGAKLKSYQSRKQHLVDKHKFPVTFDFYNKKVHPSKQHRHRLQRGNKHQLPHKFHKSVEGSDMDVDKKVDDLVSSISKLSTSDSSPSVVSFGRRHARGLTFIPRALRQSTMHNSPAQSNGQ